MSMAGSGDGGGNLTITGTLANTKTVQVGSGFLNAGAANTLTLGALDQCQAGQTISVFGSATNQAKVSITAGPASNAGTADFTGERRIQHQRRGQSHQQCRVHVDNEFWYRSEHGVNRRHPYQ